MENLDHSSLPVIAVLIDESDPIFGEAQRRLEFFFKGLVTFQFINPKPWHAQKVHKVMGAWGLVIFPSMRQTWFQKTLSKFFSNKRRLFNLDWNSTPGDVSNAIKLRQLFSQSGNLSNLKEYNFERKVTKVTLFGTGPSLVNPGKKSKDELRIGCNGLIYDSELVDSLDLDFYCVVDPVMHFGPSRGADKFRLRLLSFMERNPACYIITLGYFAEFMVECLGFPSSKVISVDGQKLQEYSWQDLLRREVPFTNNVLTMLMLPIGAMLSDNLVLTGFDGLKNEKWDHGKSVQNPEIHEFESFHPAFFRNSPENKAKIHVYEVRQLLRILGQIGVKISHIGNTWLPLGGNENPRNKKECAVVSYVPFWAKEEGHFQAWEHALTSQARERSIEYLSLVRFDHTSELSSAKKILSGKTIWQDLPAVHSEIQHLLDKNFRPTVIDYFSAVEDIAAWKKVAEEHVDVDFKINIMRSNGQIFRQCLKPGIYGSDLIRKLRMNIETKPENLVVAVDTFALFNLLVNKEGLGQLDFWPFFDFTTAQDHSARSNKKTGVFFPSLSRPEKGSGYLERMIEIVNETLESQNIVARVHTTHNNSTKLIRGQKRHLRSLGVNVIEGALSSELLSDYYASAKIAVIPYDPGTFRVRTSGILLECLNNNVIPIATSNTWAGDVATHIFGEGLTFSYGDENSFRSSFQKALDMEWTPSIDQRIARLRKKWSGEMFLSWITDGTLSDAEEPTFRSLESPELENVRFHVHASGAKPEAWLENYFELIKLLLFSAIWKISQKFSWFKR